MATKLGLKFKYLKNRMIDLGDERQYPIPQKTMPGDTKDGRKMLMATFDMNKIHEVPLADETVRLPVKPKGMSEKLHSELCDDAYRIAREARKKNQFVREHIEKYVKSGTIEIVSDPFRRETREENDGFDVVGGDSKE